MQIEERNFGGFWRFCSKIWGVFGSFALFLGVFGANLTQQRGFLAGKGVFGGAQRILGEIKIFANLSQRGARTSRQIKIRRKTSDHRLWRLRARTRATSCCRKIASFDTTPNYDACVRALVSKRVKLKWGAYLTAKCRRCVEPRQVRALVHIPVREARKKAPPCVGQEMSFLGVFGDFKQISFAADVLGVFGVPRCTRHEMSFLGVFEN